MAATIYRKNKYETWKVIYDRESNKASEKAGEIFQEMWKTKKDQDKGIVLGGLHRIHYTNYWHDASPLALFMSYTNADSRCFVAVNLHYLLTNHALLIAKKIKQKNVSNIKNGRAIVVTYDMIKGLNLPILAYRNYKFNMTRPIEYIPLDDWEEVIKAERSVWQGKFYGKSQQEIDKKAKAKRTRQKKHKKKRLKSRR